MYKEYFENHFKPTNQPSTEEVETGASGLDSAITKAVIEVVIVCFFMARLWRWVKQLTSLDIVGLT